MGEEIWKKRVLIPLWVVSILVCVIQACVDIIALFAVGEAAANGAFSGDSAGEIVSAFNIAGAVSLGLSLFTLILDFSEIVMFARHKLRPVANFVMQLIKSIIWTIWFVFTIAAVVQDNARGGSIFFSLVLFLTSTGLLIYGSIILHRHRKGTLYRGEYAPAGGNPNAKPYLAVSQPQSHTAYRPPHRDVDDELGLPPHPQTYGSSTRYGGPDEREWPHGI